MAFATAADLAARLGQAAPTGTTLTQWNAALDDATEYLRSVIGWQVSPVAEVVLAVYGDGGASLVLPATAVVSAVDGTYAPTGWEQTGNVLRATSGAFCGALTVTMTVGYETVPGDLKAWACVLASSRIKAVSDLGSLSAAGVAAVSIDDFRKSWSQGETGIELPERQCAQLRTRYGQTVFVTS